MNPLVSILIPAFNAERWIAETIQSAIDQSWPEKEIVVVDDGSSDQTLAVAKGFGSITVKVVTQPNQGAAAARNKAYSVCQGDYIQWLDADDLLAQDKVAKQMEALGGHRSRLTLVSSTWGHFFHRPDRARFVPTALWNDLCPIDYLLTNLEQGAFLQTASWLVSRELAEAAGPWDVRLLGDDDGEYFSRAILASDGIRFAPEARIFYRRVSTNRLSYVGLSPKKLDAHLLSMQLQVRNIRVLEDSERVRAACLKFLQRFMIYFYPEQPDMVRTLERLAAELGGRLAVPHLSWKYAWIQKLFGWTAAKRAQLHWNQCKSSVIGSLDRISTL